MKEEKLCTTSATRQVRSGGFRYISFRTTTARILPQIPMFESNLL
jgi:hypothetical protein